MQRRHRKRENRVLARKDGNRPLPAQLQKEIDSFTNEDLGQLATLGVQNAAAQLQWICIECHLPKEHRPTCKFNPGSSKLTLLEPVKRQLTLLQSLGGQQTAAVTSS